MDTGISIESALCALQAIALMTLLSFLVVVISQRNKVQSARSDSWPCIHSVNVKWCLSSSSLHCVAVCRLSLRAVRLTALGTVHKELEAQLAYCGLGRHYGSKVRVA